MSQYIASATPKTSTPQGESERLTAWPIYAPGSNTYWGGSRVQADRIADEFNRLLTQLEIAESERDELRSKIADLGK